MASGQRVADLAHAANLLPLLGAAFWGGAEFTIGYWFAPGAAGLFILGVYGSILAASFLGLVVSIFEPPRRPHAFSLLALIASHSAAVLIIRDITPYWMLYSHGVLIAMIVAFGGGHWMRNRQAGTALLVSCGLLTVANLSATLAFALSPPARLAFPSFDPTGPGFMDVTQRPIGRIEITHQLVNLAQIESAGRLMCNRTALHGHLSVLTDLSFGIGPRRFCPGTSHVSLGGTPSNEATAMAGLNSSAMKALGWADGRDSDLGFSLLDARATEFISDAFGLIEGGRFPWRDFSSAAQSRKYFQVDLEDEAVLITDRSAGHVPYSVSVRDAGGHSLQALFSDRFVQIWRCPAGVTRCTLSFDVLGSTDTLDVVRVSRARPATEHMAPPPP